MKVHELEYKLCTDVRMQAHVLRKRGDTTADIVTPSLWLRYGPYTSHMPGYKQAAHVHECCKIVIELCYAVGRNIVLRNFCIFLIRNLCMEVLITFKEHNSCETRDGVGLKNVGLLQPCDVTVNLRVFWLLHSTLIHISTRIIHLAIYGTIEYS
jgi:hypothetical protein